jgi:hypothetical protein
MSQVERPSEEFRSAGLGGRLFLSGSPAVPVIAIVDDDKSVRESLAGFVESVGYVKGGVKVSHQGGAKGDHLFLT